MTNPQQQNPVELAKTLQALLGAASTSGHPVSPRDLLPVRAPAARMFTVDEAFKWIENVMGAANRTERMPVTVTHARNPDGTLTIHVTPLPGHASST